MTPKVGVFSAVCAVAVGVLAFKGVDIAQAFAVEPEPTPAAEPAPAEAPPEGAASETALSAAAPSPLSPEQCLSQLDAAAEDMGLSSQEILVLRSLQKRREELD